MFTKVYTTHVYDCLLYVNFHRLWCTNCDLVISVHDVIFPRYDDSWRLYLEPDSYIQTQIRRGRAVSALMQQLTSTTVIVPWTQQSLSIIWK